jgi:hypothetical protein
MGRGFIDYVKHTIPVQVKPCWCGCEKIGAETEVYSKGNRWVVKCSRCFARTEVYPTVEEAVEAWQEDKFTEGSVMLRGRLADEADFGGLQRLAEGVVRQAGQAYASSVKNGRPDQSLEIFFRYSPFTMGLDGESIIQKIKKYAG